jgi:anaerobic selenocysteine-containing dehydrogenase
VFDHAFIAEHTSGVDDYLAAVDATPWEHIVEQSGLTLAEIELAARMYRKAERVIMCWAMGVTQHRHSVPTVQEIVNLQLLRGNVGKPGAGLSPVRGHSNVQGDRTMGIDEKPKAALLDAMEKRFQFRAACPRAQRGVGDQGHGRGRAKVFIALGGNFAQATPDTRAPTRRCRTAR